jgi:hypothetical protein
MRNWAKSRVTLGDQRPVGASARTRVFGAAGARCSVIANATQKWILHARQVLTDDGGIPGLGLHRLQRHPSFPQSGSGGCAAADGRSRAPARRGGAVQDLIQPFRHNSGVLNSMYSLVTFCHSG